VATDTAECTAFRDDMRLIEGFLRPYPS